MPKVLSKAAQDAIKNTVKVRALLMIEFDMTENSVNNWNNPAKGIDIRLTTEGAVNAISEGSGLTLDQILVDEETEAITNS